MIKFIPINDFSDTAVGEDVRPYCCSREWYQLYRDTFHYNLKRFFVEKDNKQIGEVSYVIVKSRFFGNRIISLPFSDEGGIYLVNYFEVSEDEKKEIVDCIIELLDQEAIQNNVTYTEIRGTSILLSKHDFDKKFITRNAYVKFILDTTQNYQLIRKNFDRTIIQNLKKANDHVIIHISNSIEQLRKVYNIYLEQMKKFGSPPLPKEYFIYLFKSGLSKIFLASIKGRIVAFLMTLVYRNKMYADICASLSVFDRFFPKVKLIDESIRTACRDGLKLYDFMRTRYNSGVYLHKKKWGGIQEPIYYYYRKYKAGQNLVMDPEQKCFYLPRLFLKFMPLFLLSKIGPHIRSAIGK